MRTSTYSQVCLEMAKSLRVLWILTSTCLDFDPASYKIPQLRNVLLQNDVSYPNGAKKKDLVELFNTHIKPTAEGRLKELQGVVANDEGIVYVEKKSKKSKDTEQNSSSTLKVEKTRKNPSKKAKETEEPEVRRSPRKTSKSTMLEQLEADDSDDDIQIIDESQVSPRKARGSARNASGDLGKIPVLKKSPPRTRERSPRRKASGNAKSEEPEQSEEFKPRERSPRRKVSDKKDSKTTRERSPAKKVKEETKAEPKPKKETKKKSKAKEEPKPEDRAGDESDNADLEQVTQQEFEQASPYKFGSKFESSFSKDNVFQSPGHSSPDVKPKKTIPRKRASENTSKSPRKSTKSIRKTAFSSSPEPAQNIKSPAKKALEISKFETSSPPSNFVKNDIAEGDIFESEEFSKQPFKFENVTEKIPSSIKKPTINENDKFETPNDGNASKISNLSSASSTPSKSGIKRKSLLPDFSKFKVSREFAKTLGITVQGEPEQESKEQDSNKDEDPELIDIAGDDDDEDEEDSDEPEQTANDDSVLRNLQEEIDSANSAVQKEADDAIKQVNDIFNEDKDTENVSSNDKAEKSTPKTKSGFKFSAVFGFFKQLFVFFFFVFIVIFGLWYREQRILIGYCGNEIDQPTFPNAQNEYLIRFDEFLQTLKPKCLEAPENAITLPNLKIKCRPDYVVYEPWYKVHGFFPFSDYCVKDEEKENIIKEVVSKSLELLRTKNAETKCGDGDDFEVGISDEELYEFFFESKSVS